MYLTVYLCILQYFRPIKNVTFITFNLKLKKNFISNDVARQKDYQRVNINQTLSIYKTLYKLEITNIFEATLFKSPQI